MKTKTINILHAGLVICLLAGCKLQYVVDYSAASSKAMKDQTVATGFQKSDTRFHQIFPKVSADFQGKDIEAKTTKVQTAYGAYFDSIGAVAAGDPVSYKKQFDAFEKSLAATKLVNASKAKDISTVGNAAASLLMEGYRQKSLADIFHATNPILQQHMKVLAANSDRYKTNLAKEQKLVDLNVDIGRNLAPPGQEIVWNTTRVTLADMINADRVRADAYKKAVLAVAAGHQKLTDESEHLTAKEVIEAVKTYKDTIADAYKALNP